MKLNINNKTLLAILPICVSTATAQLQPQNFGDTTATSLTTPTLNASSATVNALTVTTANAQPAVPAITQLPNGVPVAVKLNTANLPNSRAEEIRRVDLSDTTVIRQGGSTTDALGNTTLSQRETQVDTAGYSIVRTFTVGQDGIELVAGPVSYVLARPDTANPGSFIALTEAQTVPLLDENGVQVIENGVPQTTEIQVPITFQTLAAAETRANTTFIGSPELEIVTTEGAPVSTGGNLTVEGQTTTNGINNSGKAITNIANGVANTDAATVGQMTSADTAIRGEFAAADTAIRGEFAAADTAIRGAFAAADTAIRGEFAAADTALGARIDTESSTRASQDAAIRSEFAAADTSIRAAFAAADTSIRGEFAAADTAIRGEFAAADSRLQSQINENTRGIAMVAAMSNTRVEAGKTHGVDFNISQFQNETGFAFGYANRINDNLQVHCSVASTTDVDESVGRVGVAFQW